MMSRICLRMASTSNTDTLGNSLTRSTSAGRCCRGEIDAGHVGARPRHPASPGGNTRKKFGRKLSQRTLRMLATRTVRASPGDVEAQLIAELEPERLLILRGNGDQRLAEVRLRPPAALDQLVVLHQLRGPGQILLALEEAAPALPLELDRLGRRPIDRGHARTHHRDTSRADRSRGTSGSSAAAEAPRA